MGRRGNQDIARLVLTGFGIAVSEVILNHSQRFAILRLSSYLCAPNRIKSLLIVTGIILFARANAF